MSYKRSLLLIMVILFSYLYTAPISLAEDNTPLLMITARDIYMTAGEENQMEIEIKNKGSFSVYDVEITLSVPTSAPGISVIANAQKIYNEIEGGETKSFQPIIYVNRDTPLGAYTLMCQVTYIKRYRVGTLQPGAASVQLGIVVKDVSKPKIMLKVEVADPRLTAGAEDEIRVILENTGEEPVFEVDTTITSTSPYIAVIEGARFTIDRLEANESITSRPVVAISKSTPLGVYTMTVAVSYEDEDGNAYLDTFTLGVNVDSVEVENQTSIVLNRFTLTPETIRPGDIVELKLELACLGAKAHDVETLISFATIGDISPLSPTLVSIGNLEPGRSTTSSYRLLVDGEAVSGQYPVSIAISYLDSDGVPRSVVETAIVSIRGIIEFRLLNAPEVTVELGGSFELEADLLLIGTESIKFVQVNVIEDGPFRRTLDSYEYIGSVDPDSPIPFDVSFTVEADAETGDYILLLNVTYYDDLNRVRGSLLEVPISVVRSRIDSGAQEGLLGGFWIWLRRLLGIMP